MQKLVLYLSNMKMRQADFAARVGASQPTISKLLSGDALPSLELAVRIERETGGEVCASDWIGPKIEDAA
jgi:DNA-binding XRE family transcriptional regulator